MRKLYVVLFIVCLCMAAFDVWAEQPLLAPAPLLMAAYIAWDCWKEGK